MGMDIDTLTRNRLEGGRTMITGGHFGFDKQGHPQLNEGTLYSFKEAVRLYAEANDSSLGLGLLVNDIGTTCGPKACSLKGGSISREDFVLPDEYLAILAKHSVPETDVHLFWEKHLRNRAKKLYRKDHDLDKMREVYLGRNPADIPCFVITVVGMIMLQHVPQLWGHFMQSKREEDMVEVSIFTLGVLEIVRTFQMLLQFQRVLLLQIVYIGVSQIMQTFFVFLMRLGKMMLIWNNYKNVEYEINGGLENEKNIIGNGTLFVTYAYCVWW